MGKIIDAPLKLRPGAQSHDLLRGILGETFRKRLNDVFEKRFGHDDHPCKCCMITQT